MPQPDYVPIRPADRVRPTERLPVPEPWTAIRPADIQDIKNPLGRRMGNAGPDQGYALKLVRQFESRLQLEEGETTDDAILGCLAVALKRASRFGRAPVVYDWQFAFTLWGFLGAPPSELVQTRKRFFEAASHHYELQRAIADAVPEETLAFTPAHIAENIGSWRSLLHLS